MKKYLKEHILGRTKNVHTEARRGTHVLGLTEEDWWGPGPCAGMLDPGTSTGGCLEATQQDSCSGWTTRDGKPPISCFGSRCDSLQKVPHLTSSFRDISTDEWFDWFFFVKSNLESNPNTYAVNNYGTCLAPK